MADATTPADGLRPQEYLAALRSTAAVLEDHAAALDRLDAVDSWDDPDPEPAGRAAAPAPEGPGTDLARTLDRACVADEGSADFASLCSSLADGARAAAHGVSGRRLARFLAGAAEALRNVDRLDGTRMALALEAGAERLALADDGAHPGGLPAVVAASADAALAASDDGAALGDVLVSAADAGLAELEQGPLVDPHLAERGTVDAAAAGFLLVLDSLASVVTGEPLPAAPHDEPTVPAAPPGARRYRIRCALTPAGGADPEAAAELEALLHELGAIAGFHGAGDVWSVEITTAHPGAAVEAIVGFGRPSELHIGVVGDAVEPVGS
jgi:uncharacterized protein